MIAKIGNGARRHELLAAAAAGIQVGFVLGVLAGLVRVVEHRLLEFGLYHLALDTVASTLNRVCLASFALFIMVPVCISLVRPFFRGHWFRLIGLMILLLLAMGFWFYQEWQFGLRLPWKSTSLKLFGFLAVLAIGWKIVRIARRNASHRFSGALRRIRTPATIAALVLVSAVNATSVYQTVAEPKLNRNVLFITIDTLRADHLGCYGYARDTSPNIDRLATEGVRFGQAVVQWPKTSPSLASILTSTYGHVNGLMRKCRQRLPNRLVLLPEILKDAGYQTVGIVTNGNLSKRFGFHQGFDTFIEGWRAFPGERAEDLTRHALSWLSKHSSSGGFFMWLHYSDPHAFYDPPGDFDEMYVGDEFYSGYETAKLDDDSGLPDAVGSIPLRSRLGDHDVLDYYVAQYDAEIRYMDEQIGKVLDGLKRMELAKNTLVVLTADHGESLGEHNYYFEHGRLPYDDCVLVPLIFKAPAFSNAGLVIDEPVELINIMPTILDLLGIPLKGDAQGVSLASALRGLRSNLPKYAFTEAGYARNYQRVIRADGWKLVYVPDEDDQRIMQGTSFELYDLRNDPKELTNLITVETQMSHVLKHELVRWVRSSGPNDSSAPMAPITLDETTEKALRSLGYVGE